MKRLFSVAWFGFVLIPTLSFACSPLANTQASFEHDNAVANTVVPGAPEVSLDYIRRGGERTDSCSDIGQIILAITPEPAAYAYRFEVVEGKAPIDSFSDKAVVGYDSKGKQMFQFSWLEAGKAPALDFKLRITAYSKTGKKGGVSIMHIHNDGSK